MSSSPVVAVKPRRGLVLCYTKAQTFERPALYVIPEEDAETGENDADWKSGENDHIMMLCKEIDKVEAVLAKAVELRQHAHTVPVVTLRKKAPKRRPDEHWTCSQCPGEGFMHMDSHLTSYHGVGITKDAWRKLHGIGDW
jgi:hypothetical protein